MQIFHHSTNLVARVSIYGGLFFVILAGYVIYALTGSPYVTDVNEAREQPVPFSHRHHASELAIDCRYCHTSVEQSSFAGIPPTQTCMTCHSQIWTNAPLLEPVRQSYRSGKSIEWTRVNMLPDFVYFNHSIHVAKGVGCTTCHGDVGGMSLTYAANTLQMSWCLGCHREPEKYVRPKEYIFSTTYRAPSNQLELGQRLIKEYKIHTSTDCYTCHR